MKIHHLCLYLLTSALAVSVQSKPHGKHESPHKQIQHPKEKEPQTLHDGDSAILPTFLPFEASSPEPEDEAVNQETSIGKEKTEPVETGALDGAERNTPVLLSEEALTKLLQASEEEQQAMEEDKEDEDDGEEAEGGEMNLENMEGKEEKEEFTVENGEEAGKEQLKQKQVEVDELGSSTDSEIPMDLDYAADSEATDPLPTKLEENKPSISNIEDEEKAEDELPTAMEDYDSQQPLADAEETTEESQEEQTKATENLPDEQKEPLLNTKSDQNKPDEEEEKEGEDIKPQGVKNSAQPADNDLPQEKEREEETNESKNHTKGKGKKQKKTQRQRKMQSDQPALVEGPTEQLQNQEKEPESTSNTLQKGKRRKNGKWAPLVGINPVQIRTTVEMFPRTRPVVRPRLGADGQETPADPCETFRCKRGKTCKLNEEKKPSCVCQEPADCPPSFAEFEHVCGTDNQTYDTSCQLFATKCGLEGTKKGHRLHLDYTGSCKFIPPCLDTELVQFPLRMRDWLKNVLLQLYEHDSMTPGFLTAKQRARVQKLHESERRLHAGDHPIELLAQDFEKNYHMYIYPVHWQFAQMDQHPSDRFLSHSELAPLRVPLVPMEHCTSVFFQECDADKDKLVSFREWCQCFGIKDEDMDTKLLF